MKGHDLSITALSAALRECYEIGALPEADQKLYYLILRYKGRVSQRLLDKLPGLRARGKIAHAEELKRLVAMPKLEFLKPGETNEPNWTASPIIYSPPGTKITGID